MGLEEKNELGKLNFKEKLIGIQSDLKTNVEQSAKPDRNSKSGLKYAYSKESDVLKVVKPLLDKYKLGYALSQGDSYKLEKFEEANKYGGTTITWVYESMGTITIFDKESDLSNSIDSNSLSLNIAFIGSNNDPAKAYGSALTYGVKFALKKVFGLPDDDLDPDNEQGQEKAHKQEKPKFTNDMEKVLAEIAKATPLGTELKTKIKIKLGDKKFEPKNIIEYVQNDTDLMNELINMLGSEE